MKNLKLLDVHLLDVDHPIDVELDHAVARKAGAIGKAASNDNRAADVRLDQYYTNPEIAERCYAIFKAHFDPAAYQMVEPSAGTGSFFKLLPPGSRGYDVDPRCPGVQTVDFLTVSIASKKPIAIIGNPPFGKNASTAVRFFNHAAKQSDVIALILPRTFRKASIQNRLHRAFHLLHEETMPDHAFEFRGKPYNVPAVFQIWVRRDEDRDLIPVEITHPDFVFTTLDDADFAIQRVGARAGRIHRDFARSRSSHYFIRVVRGRVEAKMKRLELANIAGNVAGNPSLAKSEIVALYREDQ